MRCFMRILVEYARLYAPLSRPVVAVSGGIVRGTLFAAWCLVFDVIVTHFLFYQLHIGNEVVIYRTQNTADTDIRPATKFKRANYEHKRHDYTSHST